MRSNNDQGERGSKDKGTLWSGEKEKARGQASNSLQIPENVWFLEKG